MIELPYSFSQVNSTNNALFYRYVDSTGVTINTSVIIPTGNYNILNLNIQIIASLVSSLNANGKVITIDKFTFTYNSNTGLNTLVMSGLAFTATITLKFAQSFVLGIMLGFPASDFSFGTALSLVSPNKVFCNPITAVYLRSETLKFQSNYEAIVDKYTNSDVLAKIPVTTLPNSIIYFRTQDKYLISNKFIPEINFYLSDNLSTTYQLDMQGLNYGINILIEEVQIKDFNSYKDKLDYGEIKMPKELVQKRDNLLTDLIKRKQELEDEIKSRKEGNKQETIQDLNKNNEI
jgi:hypothetical protein